MPTLELEGVGKVEVDPSFLELSPADQERTVQEIVTSIKGRKTFGEALQSVWDSPTPGGAVDLLKTVATGARSALNTPMGMRRGDYTDNPDAPEPVGDAAVDMLKAAAIATPGAPRGAGGIFAVPRTQRAPVPVPTPAREAAPSLVRDAADLGVDLPRVVATDSPFLQRAGASAAATPLGEPIRGAVQDLGRALGSKVEGIADSLGSATVQEAGTAAGGGIRNWLGGGSKAAEREAWGAVSVPETSRSILNNTVEAIGRINAQRAERAAPAINNPQLMNAIGRAEGMGWDGLKGLRTDFGLNNARLLEQQWGLKSAEVKEIYGALTKDLEAMARSVGQDAVWRRAVAQSRLTNMQRRALEKVVGREGEAPETVFGRLARMAGQKNGADANRLLLAKNAMGEQGWGSFQSAFLRSLGRRNPTDAEFNPAKFAKDWAGLNDTFKGMLQPEHRQALDKIARVGGAIEQKVSSIANSSRTTNTLTGAMSLVGMVSNPILMLKVAIPGMLISRWLASPVGAKAVSQWTDTVAMAQRLPPGQARALMERANVRLASVVAGVSGDKPALIFEKLKAAIPSAQQGSEDVPSAEAI